MQGGVVHQQKRSLFPGLVRKPRHHGGLQGVKIVLVVPVDDSRTSATPIFFGDCESALNRTHHNTSNTLKASMVTGFANIEAFREPKVLLGYC